MKNREDIIKNFLKPVKIRVFKFDNFDDINIFFKENNVVYIDLKIQNNIIFGTSENTYILIVKIND